MKAKVNKRTIWLLAALLGAAMLLGGCSDKKETSDEAKESTQKQQETLAENKTSDSGDTASSAAESEKTDGEQIIPYKIDDGKLIVESVFQLSGTNPDCNDEEGENIGSIQLKNSSEEFLEKADIIIKLDDGSQLTFRVEDIPAGKSVLAFDINNQVYDTKNAIEEITADTSYSEASLLENKVSADTADLQITLENISGDTLENLTVTYHCIFDDAYYGGKSYVKTVESLGAGETTALDASECYLGEAEVVKVQE